MNFEYDYQLLSDHLLAMGAISSAAEIQGMLCGQLAGGKSQADEAWVKQARDFMDIAHFDAIDDHQAIILFILNESRSRLLSDDFKFVPLLPDDACPLTDKARELGAWCRGFLNGFGASGVTKDTQLAAEVAEVLRDLAQISQATKAVEDEEDETENDWYELVEYLRAGVYTVYAEMNNPIPKAPLDIAATNKGSMH